MIRMRAYFFLVMTLFISGCASAPRPYDGVLGYRTESQSAGLQITYVDEAKTSAERILSYITEICSEELGSAPSSSHVQIMSIAPFEQQVSMNIQIPVSVQGIGYKSNAIPVPGVAMQSSIAHTDRVVRTMKLKKVVALCSTAP